jgi:glycine/D-amino acid oxidase-like deaminating enzyme
VKPLYAAVVGGGFFGLRMAIHLAEKTPSEQVVLFEERAGAMELASLANQARIHSGYHYPRSILTGYRSRVNVERFSNEFAEAVDRSFTHVYAIAANATKTSPRQFVEFCRRIGALAAPTRPDVAALFDSRMIAASFEVSEGGFDATILRSILLQRAERAGVDIRCGEAAQQLASSPSGPVLTTTSGEYRTRHTIAAVYATTNDLLRRSGLEELPLQLEWAEMPLVAPPAVLGGAAITVMDGPFFSLMPFPSRDRSTLSHVRYTPHMRWQGATTDAPSEIKPRRSAYPAMITDAQRYVPALAELRHDDSIWSIKAVLRNREATDSRPILFRTNHGMAGLTLVLGGKLDNVYDALDELDRA